MGEVLNPLDFLHTEAGVIHTGYCPTTDIQQNNILLGIKDESILANSEQAELETLVPRKSLKNRIIYISRHLPISYGIPVLCDLSEACIGTEHQRGDIMPDLYHAPEHDHLFRARDEERKLNDEIHLAEMHAVLGKPPSDFLARSERSSILWDEDGSVPLSNRKFEILEERLKGNGQEDFLRFLRRMLCWCPEDRATAKELLFDPWLMQGLFKENKVYK
ncbi:hypothetical protein BDV10DRAFT_196768 [Aspergillus recurvatus]